MQELEVYDLSAGAIVIPAGDDRSTRFLSLSTDRTQATLVQPEFGASHAIVDLATGSTFALILGSLRGPSAGGADGRYLLAGAKLVRMTDVGVVRDYATGQLCGIESDATPEKLSILVETDSSEDGPRDGRFHRTERRGGARHHLGARRADDPRRVRTLSVG